MLKRSYQLFIMFYLSLCAQLVTAGVYTEDKNVNLNFNDSQVTANELHNAQSRDFFSERLTSEPLTIEVEDSQDDGFTLFDTDIPHFLSATRRIVSDDNCVGHDIKPEYFLLVAFLPPALLDIAKASTVIPKPSFHWTSRVTSSSRLSGWKESNLIYSQQHSRLS
ncbi:hypothetical protein L4C54_15290 [Vibrio lamellibrachiae]|uniref:hypothetical protein n=1 Tax=Vibrio lamellibrachiae TaxID=2910253 RepID=UPI003D106874